MKIKFICQWCGKEFEDYLSNRIGKRIFCSCKCYYGNKIIKKCKICGKKFKVIKSRENKAKFCSKKCLSLFNSKKLKGKITWNKGLTKKDNKILRKLSQSYKGKTLSKETRKKIGEAHQGEKSYLWKGGITPINHIIRSSFEYKEWRLKIFIRDNYICQKYKTKGGKLHSHHIKNFSKFPELRFKVSNGITLSEKAHKEFHKIYGIKNNTKEQIIKFLI